MKRIMKRMVPALAAALCIMLAFAQTPVFSMTAQGEPDGVTRQKLLAFWQQEAFGGLTNGEAVYEIYWGFTPEHYNYGAGHGSYDGTWSTKLVNMSQGGDSFIFAFSYREPVWMEAEMPDGSVICADGYEDIYPELYGDLDLSYTCVSAVKPSCYTDTWNSQRSTHISSAEFDGCELLTEVFLRGQEHLETVSALGCSRLAGFKVNDCACGSIAFKTTGIAAPVYIAAQGEGAVGVDAAGSLCTLYAYSESDNFLGWYNEGGLVSAERVFSTQAGGSYTAVFEEAPAPVLPGDIDCSGVVDMADISMLFSFINGSLPRTFTGLANADANGDGEVNVMDVTAILGIIAAS